MFYDRNKLEHDLMRVHYRYGDRNRQGVVTATQSKIGKLVIDNSEKIHDGEGVTYDGVRLDFNQLIMTHPAAEHILALAVETDEYYRFSSLFRDS